MTTTRHLAAFHLHAFDRVNQSAAFLDEWNHGLDDAVDLATRVLGRLPAYLRADFASWGLLTLPELELLFRAVRRASAAQDGSDGWA